MLKEPLHVAPHATSSTPPKSLQGIYKGYSGNVAQKLKLEELRVEHEPSASSSEAAEKSTPRRLLGSVLTCSIPVTEGECEAHCGFITRSEGAGTLSLF